MSPPSFGPAESSDFPGSRHPEMFPGISDSRLRLRVGINVSQLFLADNTTFMYGCLTSDFIRYAPIYFDDLSPIRMQEP
jgi:hypothetical protein